MKREYLKAVYGPSTGKTLHNLLKRELVTNFGYEDKLKIADLLIETFMDIVNTYSIEKEKLSPYQILWPAIPKDDFPGYGKSTDKITHKTVILTLWETQELEALANGTPKAELLKSRIARLCKQTYAQDALLSMADVALILNIHASYASNLRKQWEKENNEILNTRGSYHDLGRGMSHKKQIIKDHLNGLYPSEIARKHKHDVSSVNRYIQDFERTLPLFMENQPIAKIAFYTRLSVNLVQEYYKIYLEFYKNNFDLNDKNGENST